MLAETIFISTSIFPETMPRSKLTVVNNLKTGILKENRELNQTYSVEKYNLGTKEIQDEAKNILFLIDLTVI